MNDMISEGLIHGKLKYFENKLGSGACVSWGMKSWSICFEGTLNEFYDFIAVNLLKTLLSANLSTTKYPEL